MATSTFVSASGSIQANGFLITVLAPGGLAVGQVMVAFCIQQTPTYTGDWETNYPGWTKAGYLKAYGFSLAMFWKIADATDAAASSFSFYPPAVMSGYSSNTTAVQMVSYSVPNGGVIGPVQLGINANGIAASATPATNAVYVVCGFGMPSTTGIVPSGMTLRVGGGAAAQKVSDQVIAAGTATGAKATQTDGTQHFVGSLFIVTPTAPAASTLNSPIGSAAVDATAPITLDATYRSTDMQPAGAYALRIKTSAGAYQYWNNGGGILQSGIVWNGIANVAPDGDLPVTFPAGVLANGNTYNWSIATQETGNGLQGGFGVDATFITQPAPTVSGVTPSGSVTTTTSPTTTWTPHAGGGATVNAFRVVWESGAYSTTPGSGSVAADTGMVTGTATSTVVPTSLVNGTTYRVFVQVQQSPGQLSTWAYSTFTVTITPPSTPTLSAVAAVDGTTGAPYVALSAHTSDTGPLYTYANTAVEIQYSSDGGHTWNDVRRAAALPVPVGRTATAPDYEAPLGQAMKYRARVIGTITGAVVVGVWSTIPVVTLYSRFYWLADPTDPTTAVSFPLTTQAPRVKQRTEDVVPVLGAADPVLEFDVRQAALGAFGWMVTNPVDLAILEALLERPVPLLQRTPNERAWPGDAVYFQTTGPRTITRVGNDTPNRIIDTSILERGRP